MLDVSLITKKDLLPGFIPGSLCYFYCLFEKKYSWTYLPGALRVSIIQTNAGIPTHRLGVRYSEVEV